MVLSVGLEEGVCPPQPFPDVANNQWYCGWVDRLTDEGIAEGYPDGTFRPDVLLNRAEVAALIVRALGFDDPPVPASDPVRVVRINGASEAATSAVEGAGR